MTKMELIFFSPPKDLELLNTRRNTIQTKLETLAEKERALVSREHESVCCSEKSAAQSRANALEAKVSDLEQQASRCRQEQGLLKQKIMDLEKQLSDVQKSKPAEASTLPSTQASRSGGAPARISQGLHEHGAHHAVQPVVLKPFASETELFEMNKSFVPPPFLEPLAREWSFTRDASSAIGYLNLMPFPKSVTFEHEFVEVDAAHVVPDWSDDTEFSNSATARFQKRLASLVAKDGLAHCALHARCKWIQSAAKPPLRIAVSCGEAAPSYPVSVPDESYSLSIDKTGQVTINAKQAVGVVRALATLLQLATKHGEEKAGLYFPVIKIEDAPVYRWRGLLLDVARHFHPVEQVLQLLNGMEATKLNVLHLHLSDDQGFRVEVRSMPELHRKGSGGLYFTHEQIESIVHEAALRGIRVVPEIDMPAHAGAILMAYPELASGSVPSALDTNWGQRPWVLDPTKASVLEWITTVLKEMTTLFRDEYFHIGGDEVLLPPLHFCLF